MKVDEKTKGILCILSAGFCFACMTLFLKLAGDLPTAEKAFFRNFFALFPALFILLKEHVRVTFGNRKGLLLTLLRAVAGTVGIFGNFYAVDHMVLPDANMLNKLSPFFAVLFSFFILREKIRPYQLCALVVAFTGALFIIKPGFEGGVLTLPAFCGLIGGAGAGLAYTCLRAARKEGVPGPFIVFFFSAFSCVACIPAMVPVAVLPTRTQILFLVLTSLAATGGQFSITAAYSHAPAREISVYDYSQIIFAALLGMIFLNELPDALSIAGYFIILGASVFMFLKNRNAAD